MATQLQIRRGTSSQVAAFTGAEGEVVVNTTNDSIHVNDGSTAGGFEMARADLNNVSDTSLNAALTGNTVSALTVTALTTGSITTTGNISFGDNDKAIFGAGSDLQIYHDGSNSYIDDAGTGNLRVRANSLELTNADYTLSYIQAVNAGSVSLFHNGSTKLATTSTGIDVTGTATMDDAHVPSSGSYEVGGTASGTTAIGSLSNSAGKLTLDTDSTRSIHFKTGGNLRQFIDGSTGDISFYEDTGTTPKLFWDASAESLTLSGSGAGSLTLDRGASSNQIKFANAGSTLGYFGYLDGTGFSIAGSDGASDVVIDSSGRVGIGVINPSSYYAKDLVVSAADEGGITIAGGTNDQNYLMFADGTSGSSQYKGYIGYDHPTDMMQMVTHGALRFYNGASSSEMGRFDASGNLLVGKTSPDNTTAGTTIYGPVAKGAASFVRDAGNTLVLNRLTSDGEILAFRKDGSTVGSIGIESGGFYIDGEAAHSGLSFGGNSVVPRDSGARVDSTVDLGSTAHRFKDLRLSNQIIGGFGAATTSGTADWNHSTNARSGMGQTLLFGTATNGPGPNAYYHATSFEYSSKDGTGNMTQLAIGYNTNRIFMRNRYNNSWSSWVEK